MTGCLKTWSCIFSLHNLCSDAFPHGDPLRLLGEGSPSVTFLSGNSRPHRQVREALLNCSHANSRVYRATDFSLVKLFYNVKQRCHRVRLAAEKGQAVEAEVVKE